MAGIKDDIQRIYAESHVVGKYILVMIALFVTLRLSIFLGLPLDRWLALPQQPWTLLTRPWTVLTYMFTHIDTRHIFWNMVLLYSGGRIFIDMLGEKRFVKTYWMGGLLGGVIYFVVYNLDPSLSGFSFSLLGASAAVLAVLVAATVYRPDYIVALPLMGQVKLIYITLILLVITLPLSRANFGGDIAHLGGILWGLFYGWRVKNSEEPAQWFDDIAGSVVEQFRPLNSDRNKSRAKRAKMKTYTNSDSTYVPRDDKEYNAIKKAKQDRIDRILEKISKSGYESLTSEEKTILFKASNKDQNA